MQLRNFLVPKLDFPYKASTLRISTKVVGKDIIDRENSLKGRPFCVSLIYSLELEL